ncbi:MAG: hypothetical protein A3I88_03490 [Candidatus Portnoybacteria bacterium RIFCSPLOWO2_12_FULL_39_9]|uniref:Toxin YoeB n=1 Tax=Candidatus Portnoybacteria bacterium RIFCSPHIGHO2_12_FULL_38_9 TaxID=1801997 RepID=A0A1G2FI64_9BACT|nr:MAG: hypothetical protein A3H00_02660 [Candidatus Portnoybacteria bacterium RBG_13_40_8]OGZ36130.1 MAG: hypothetical protein A2646_01525 [Candidatus Portnoybacteria bacterium RIFCSPHIGHO2_02_FULL_39_12]OGZ37268.1 MAG: hypothetical protein A3J64_01385 [Candidatus Portnoybacteria bacterium RIFCSPHIGHO2_12_FULL_38_9]OGZ39000.1 MAG: hypothetical protein A3F21_00865 [Candidatus Portnoybacteria bacterium RIFCSPLOWO2_01_FULL_38_39]OGZ40668.1 MAG: hypothetical protein A3I88_03490 [Candidatus Portnoy
MLIIYPSKKFEKSYKQLPKQIKIKAKQKDLIFRENPFDSRLKTHKLKGELKECYAYSVDYSYRVLFHFINRKTVLYLDIGTHRIYQ